MGDQAHHEKAQRYISSLDAARIAGNWHELPELVRKVTKHAPDRKFLIQVAKIEGEIANYAISASRRPSSTPPIPDAQISLLETELRTSEQPFEEVVQGQTSLLWARWVGPPQPDRSVPSVTFEPARAASDATSMWTKICVVKATYIRGMLFGQAGKEEQKGELHDSILPWMDSNRSLVVSTPQLLYWAQQLLGQVALGQKQQTGSTVPLSDDKTAPFRLQAFRHWAALAVKNQDVSASTYGNGPGHLSKLVMWRAYYRFMSSILHQTPGSTMNISISRPELATELRRVETSYESELLRQARFPRANESNTTIEGWVEEVISNWKILCGPDWSDSDLGEGGRNAVGRNVLDMLYRAATKTFHSTLILRRLFQVHKSLTDFDLAYHALDTYIELIDRARARAAKSKGPATDWDGDDLFLRTISEGIEGLCSFGRRSEAEKAYELCLKLEDLLEELEPRLPDSTPNGLGHTNGDAAASKPTLPSLPADLLEIVYRAIGVGKSHWARWTPFSENRSTLQSEAVEFLQKAAAQKLPPEQLLKTLYALGRLLAETRDIDQAISIVKKALACGAAKDQEDNTYRIQRQLIPFWHLLALLLTSRQSFEIAGQSCVAAFEQFSPPEIIFGHAPGASGMGEKQSTGTRKTGLVDDMECDELQKIIEIRITDLALTELIEGPEHAVNSSNELLALYSRLFERYGALTLNEERSRTKVAQPPKSSAGTVKSLRDSLFSRKRIGRSSESTKGQKINETPSIAEELRRPSTKATQATQTTQAPTIHVTNEDEKPSPHKHRIFRHSHEHSGEDKRHFSGALHKQGSRRRLSRSQSRVRKETNNDKSLGTTPEMAQASDQTAEKGNPELETIPSQDVPALPVSANHDSSAEAKQPLNKVPHNLDAHDKIPPPAQHQDQPPEQDVRLPVVDSSTTRTDPGPRFSKSASQRHALSLLVKIWLIIATLYRRANMFDDSREACDEAAKVAMKVEGMVASVESSARAFGDSGWGGRGKSSDELWADVYCERAELLMAIARAREEKEGQVTSDGVREAVDQYEQCLMHFADHAGGIVGLSNVLLDYYERKVELGKRADNGKGSAEGVQEEKRRTHRRDWSRISEGAAVNGLFDVDAAPPHTANPTPTTPSHPVKDDDLKKTPENLNRLAARDRAYGLLSTLTKLGTGWDNSEAWFALARAHELGGEMDKAKEILWWCVELEDTRPIRHWGNVGCGGYVL
ncbi:uncharacterized protein Z518_01015 [Rhinocladiella mackenziei CBS 650.93]|uniref:Filamentation protein (Rhf1) n=1 Tax=Rhinocladiella mackenziei CBS 650.93 TaxID=1442369 RepID=A0A0D2IV24_9EURO|nr:uncharacterized protein Z518_01015 [Rhinocladiella mackenziei CBS 650.93]KIX09934.1 hypothetical protein Z518_01015 [Rhinocladiella mackenziei CBS 650.93]